MKSLKTIVAVLAAASLALSARAAPAGGRADGKRALELREPALMLGATVPPGAYTLSWIREKGSAGVRLTLTQKSRVIAAGKGLWIESETPSRYEALVYQPNDSGKSALAEIRFRGSSDLIRIGEPPAAPPVAEARPNAK